MNHFMVTFDNYSRAISYELILSLLVAMNVRGRYMSNKNQRELGGRIS